MMKEKRKAAQNQRLKHERELHGWGQADVAAKVGTNAFTVARWESGAAFPSPHFRQKLCELFGKDAQELGLIREEVEDTAVELQLVAQRTPGISLNSQAVPASSLVIPVATDPLLDVQGTARSQTARTQEANSSPITQIVTDPLLVAQGTTGASSATQTETGPLPGAPFPSKTSTLLLYGLLTACGICIAGIVLGALGKLPSQIGGIASGLGFLIGLITAILQIAKDFVHYHWQQVKSWRLPLLLASMITVGLLTSFFLLLLLSTGGAIRPLQASVVPISQASYHLYPGYYVNNVAWSPNGKYIASANGDHTVWVLDALNKGEVYTYRGHISYVNDIAWSPDSKRIASASADGTAQVWDATTGDHVLVYRGHFKGVWALTWSPDGKYIASSGHDATVQIWDAATGRRMYTYHGHSKGAWSLAWSPDGNRIASASEDGTVQVWDALSGNLIYVYHGHAGPVYDAVWSPDGKRIASASADGTVQVWDATTGNNIYTYRGHSNSVQAVAWSPDGKYIASAGKDQTVRVWNATTGRDIYIYHGHSDTVYGVVWSPDSKYIASASEDGTVRIWSVT